MEISGRTKLICIFGDPVEHSLSPAMHNAAFKKMKLDYAYVAFHVKPRGLGKAVRALKALNFAGANITVPHKERVMQYLDEIDEDAQKLGAVNTIVNRDGRLIGYNTDGRGFVKSLNEEAGFDPAKKKVYMCGAGGAARGIGYALAKAGVGRLYLYDVDGPKLDRMTMDINNIAGRLFVRPAIMDPDFIRSCDLVINATPLGMKETDPLPLARECFRPGQVFYDIIYNPAKTKCVKVAEGAGAKAVNGLGMLLYQGVFAFEHWLGQTPPADVMRRALMDKLGL